MCQEPGLHRAERPIAPELFRPHLNEHWLSGVEDAENSAASRGACWSSSEDEKDLDVGDVEQDEVEYLVFFTTPVDQTRKSCKSTYLCIGHSGRGAGIA